MHSVRRDFTGWMGGIIICSSCACRAGRYSLWPSNLQGDHVDDFNRFALPTCTSLLVEVPLFTDARGAEMLSARPKGGSSGFQTFGAPFRHATKYYGRRTTVVLGQIG